MEEPYRLTPQLALRIGILGMLVIGAFGVLFLRLWALQVLAGERYLNEAQNNQLRVIRTAAPRGAILDRNGAVVVDNVAGHSVQIWPADLPENGRFAMLRRLADILDVRVVEIAREIDRRKGDPLTPVIVKRGIHRDQVMALNERRREFPGVRVVQSYLRDYPHKALAAHLLGYVGEASKEQLRGSQELRLGDEAGQSGIEAAYDEVLRGEPGLARLRVDSQGAPVGGFVPTQDSRPGLALRLTLDIRLQRAAERALRYGIDLARADDCYGCWSANGGAIVALEPQTGEVLAMASNPPYQPSIFVGRNQRKLNQLKRPERNFPLLNRATSGRYPPGSTFKPVTAIAAMEQRLIQPYDSLPCTGSYTAFKQRFANWNPYFDEMMTLPTALATSCDTYFYILGERFYRRPPAEGHPFQDWAARLGFGQRTGFDVGFEDPGLLPTPEWRQRTFKTELDRDWKPGHSIQLAIGQTDLLVTPLQMARFYALLANGGQLVTPHVVAQAEQPTHGARPVVRQVFAPPPPKPSGVDAEALRVIHEGLVAATQSSYGTSFGVFGNFPYDIAGKTGTAEKFVGGLPRDQSWWCGYGPAASPELVVCALIENGGHGSDAAAPAARRVFEAYFGVDESPPLVDSDSD